MYAELIKKIEKLLVGQGVIPNPLYGIHSVMDWAKTTRGGRQYDLIASSENPTMCRSAYGLCE